MSEEAPVASPTEGVAEAPVPDAAQEGTAGEAAAEVPTEGDAPPPDAQDAAAEPADAEPADSGEAKAADAEAAEGQAEGATEGATEEAGEGPAKDPLAEGDAEPTVEHVEVPATSLSVDVSHPNTSLAQDPGDVATRALSAVEGAIEELEQAETEIQDDSKRASITKRKSQLLEHQEELKQIISSSRAGSVAGSEPPSTRAVPTSTRNSDSIKTLPSATVQNRIFETLAAAEPTVDPTVRGFDFDGLATQVEDLKLVRRQLDCAEDGRPVEEAPVGDEAAWYDSEVVEKEVAELRRVRHQIRCLFGGFAACAGTDLKVDDLLSEDPKGFEAPPGSGGYAGTGAQASVAMLYSPISHPSPFGGPSTEVAQPAQPTAPQPEAQPFNEIYSPKEVPEPSPKRPPSHAGSQASYSSGSTWNDDERRKERKEKKHRRHRDRSERAERDRSLDKPKSNEPLNWAEEVVKASMDPQNQWEFPGNDAGRPQPQRPPRARGQPSWEQPRQRSGGMGGPPRSGDVAAKARERAEEVMRKERELENQRLAG